MKTYISFLRGINVSGQKIIKMADLKILLEKNNLHNVSTYIQSGNIVFNSDEASKAHLEKIIKEAIEKKYGFKVPVMVLLHSELEKLITECPFDINILQDKEMVYFTMLSDFPDSKNVSTLENTKDETDNIKVIEKVVYIHCKRGFSKTTYNNYFTEKILGVEATTRNLNTIKKILLLAKKIM